MEDHASKTHRGVPVLITTLFKLASDPDYQDTICFGPNDTGICFKNKVSFKKNILGKHIKAKKLSSVIRQLNKHNFNSIKMKPLTLHHPAFIKD